MTDAFFPPSKLCCNCKKTSCNCLRGLFELVGSVTASYSNVMCLDYLSQSITGRSCLHLEQSCCLKTSKAITTGGKQRKTLMASLKSTKEKKTKQTNLFNSNNEEDERKYCRLCAVQEFAVCNVDKSPNEGFIFEIFRVIIWTSFATKGDKGHISVFS